MHQQSPRVVIIGSGFGGIGAAVALARAGHRNIRILEKKADIGGVWRDNVYPGATCDVPSSLYSYSYLPKLDWPRMCSGQADILDYLRGCLDEYGLTGKVTLNTEITTASFDETRGVWLLETSVGETLEADVVVAACGLLNKPAYPKLANLGSFTGTTFHSAEWNDEHDLTGRSVAVLGTGSSAIQFIPKIAPDCGRLTVFQRTANWIFPKFRDREFTDRDRARLQRWPWWRHLERWTFLIAAEGLSYAFTRNRRRMLSIAGLLHRRLLHRQVADPVVREKLHPEIALGCKRIGFANDFYPVFNRPNVELVTDDVVNVTEHALITADGRRHEVDTIIFGTGFHTSDPLSPMLVRGVGGVTLEETWNEGPRAYYGISLPDFPNFFLVYGPNTNVGAGSVVPMIEAEALHIAGAVTEIAKNPGVVARIRRDVFEASDRRLQRRLARTVWTTCESWYRHPSGRVTANWPGTMWSFMRRASRFNRDDYLWSTCEVRASDAAAPVRGG